MFQIYVLNVSSVSDVCCKCFIWMLHVYASVLSRCCIYMQVFQVFSYVCCKCFHLDVAMFVMATHVFSSFSGVLPVFQTHFASVFSCFERMLQVFHLNIAKVDRMLHMLNRTHLLPQSPIVAAGRCRAGRRSSRAVGWRGRHPGPMGPRGHAKRVGAENRVRGNRLARARHPRAIIFIFLFCRSYND
jgi:hypothetical protein